MGCLLGSVVCWFGSLWFGVCVGLLFVVCVNGFDLLGLVFDGLVAFFCGCLVVGTMWFVYLCCLASWCSSWVRCSLSYASLSFFLFYCYYFGLFHCVALGVCLFWVFCVVFYLGFRDLLLFCYSVIDVLCLGRVFLFCFGVVDGLLAVGVLGAFRLGFGLAF